jgi:ribosomal protein S18 acetylase RimI-like enzyme
MRIVRLQAGDEEAACEVVECVKFVMDEVVGVSVDRERMRGFLADGRSYLIAAYVDDVPAGFVLGYRLPRIDGAGPMMFLYEVGVLDRYRRRGIGRALMEDLKGIAQENGCCKMFVSTSASNAAAMALYRSAGGEGGALDDAAGFWWKW